MKDPLIKRAAEGLSKIYTEQDHHIPAIMIPCILSIALLIAVTISVFWGHDNGFANFMKSMVDFFGSNFWVALLISSISSLVVNMLFSSIFFKYYFKVNKDRLLNDRFLENAKERYVVYNQVSLFWVFGSGFLVPVYITTVLTISLILTPIIRFNPFKNKNFGKLADKLVPGYPSNSN